LARASGGKLEPSQEWVNPVEAESSAVLFERHPGQGLMDATFELVYSAEAEFFRSR
jgi:hypothetical protein